MDYEALLKVLQVETSDERGILAAALVDNILSAAATVTTQNPSFTSSHGSAAACRNEGLL